MRMFTPVLAGALVFGLSLDGRVVCAQSPLSASPKPTSTEAEKKKLREKAYQLLDDTVTETQGLTIPGNRVVLLANLLPSLWKRDPGQAREVAGTLLTGIATQELQPQSSSGDEDVDTQPFSLGPGFDANFRLYTGTLQKIGEADPQTALELLAVTRGPMTAAKPERNRLLDAYAKQLEFAAAKKDPAKLYELGKKSLDGGEFIPAISLVQRIAERDSKLAAKFFGEIAAGLSVSSLAPEGKLRAFLELAELLPASKTGDPRQARAGEPQPSRTEPKFEIDEGVRRTLFADFAQTVLAALQKKPSDSNENGFGGEPSDDGFPEFNDPQALALQANRFLPQFTRYAPRLADQIRQRMPREAGGQEHWEADILKRFDENRLRGQEMEFVASGIIPRLIGEGKMDEARRLIAKVPDQRTREALSRQAESAEAVKSASSEKATDADFGRLLGAARTSGQRIRLLLVVAGQAVTRKEYGKAGDALDQALGLANQIQNPRIQMTAKMNIAALYAGFAPERAFDIYEPLIDKLNEFLGGAAIVGAYVNFGGGEMIRGNEFNLEGGALVGEIIPMNQIPFQALAAADFDRTRALVDRVRFPEIRAKLRLDLLTAVLPDKETGETAVVDTPESKAETSPR